MPRKKEFALEDKFSLPGCDELFEGLKDGKMLAIQPTLDFVPIWEYTNRETFIVFTRWLLKSPAFEQDKKRNVYLSGHARCSNAPLLLFALSGELADFFLKEKLRAKSYLKILKEPLSIVEKLKGYKSPLINFRIVKNADVFDNVYVQIGEWMVKLSSRIGEKIPSYKKGELVARLYPYFKGLTKLTDAKIYRRISQIMQHLGLEEGDIERISGRIRKRLERKGIKEELATKSLDLDRLRKTVRHLISQN